MPNNINFATPTKPKNSPKDWAIVVILTLIPIVNVVMYVLWLFGQRTEIYKRTFKHVNHNALIAGFVISILITLGVIALIVMTIMGGANGTNPLASISNGLGHDNYQPTTGYPQHF